MSRGSGGHHSWGSQWRSSRLATKKMGLKPGNAACGTPSDSSQKHVIPPKKPISQQMDKKQIQGHNERVGSFLVCSLIHEKLTLPWETPGPTAPLRQQRHYMCPCIPCCCEPSTHIPIHTPTLSFRSPQKHKYMEINSRTIRRN